MSRYAVNKLMRLVNMDPAHLAAYKADRAAFVADWEAAPSQSDFPSSPRGGTLTAGERTALVDCDFAALYRLGAHPYLLWSFTEAALTPEVERAALAQSYRDATAPIGYPDIRTTPADTGNHIPPTTDGDVA